MMQSELLIQTHWPIQSYLHSNLDHYCNDFISSTNSSPENSMISYDHNSENMMSLDDVSRWLCDDDDKETEGIQLSDASECVLNGPEFQMGVQNLLKAYADAITMGQIELAEVIVRCINERTNPIGPAVERIAFNLFKCEENYLQQESMRNYKSAFRAFYEIFPYGKFAHFAASSAIIESVPAHVESVNIVDFDLCEGSQWPAVIEAIARMKKSLIITSIKLDQDSQFEQTKRNLFDCSRNLGLNLKVHEIDMAQIVNKMEGREFVVFNCMVNLPHMGRTSKSTQVTDFLNIAKLVLAKREGIITFGDQEMDERMTDFSSFFDKNLVHYKALYESMEFGFPRYLNDARIAMETLFLAPFISSKSWFQKWEEQREIQTGFGLNGRKLSKESWNEARELVKEGESPYGIRIEGGNGNGNQMVLGWNGIPLVKVSVWV